MPKNIFRNGTESRESLPLRSEANRKTTSKRPTGWHTRNLPDCNGTKSRESLPLRNEENRNQPPKGLQEETQGICPTATAPNHGNHCRCGARRIEKRPPKGLLDGNTRNLPTATAPEHRTAKDTQAGQVLPEHLAKVYPKGRKTVHLCNWALPGTPIQALWQWSGPHAAAKVYPKGGKTVHLCNWALPETPPQVVGQWSGPHDAAKVYPKGGKMVHLCNWAYGLTGS